MHDKPSSPSYKISFDFTFNLGVEAPPNLQRHLQEILSDWYDGRFPFNVEQIHVGLEGIIKKAIEKSIYAIKSEFSGGVFISGEPAAIAQTRLSMDQVHVNLYGNQDTVTKIVKISDE